MDEETQKALCKTLHLDKPILAITEEDQHLLLHLLGGEVVRVDRHTLTAQLPLEGLGVSRADPSLLAESVASTASQPRRSHRKP
jgi:hypothetical protein